MSRMRRPASLSVSSPEKSVMSACRALLALIATPGSSPPRKLRELDVAYRMQWICQALLGAGNPQLGSGALNQFPSDFELRLVAIRGLWTVAAPDAAGVGPIEPAGVLDRPQLLGSRLRRVPYDVEPRGLTAQLESVQLLLGDAD